MILKTAAAERLICVFAAVLCVLCLHIVPFTSQKAREMRKRGCKAASQMDAEEGVCVRAHSEAHCLSLGLSLCNN